MGNHLVEQGECLTSIAHQYGFFWQTLWDHPNNAALKQKRQSPNTLLPGDTVHIPEKRPKEESRETGSLHRFRVKGIPARLRLRLLWEGQPRGNEPFTLDIEGNITNGNTDAGGRLDVPIPPRAVHGTLLIGEGSRQTKYELELGHLNPVDELSGVQARLHNLGFPCGAADGLLQEATQEALRAFQRKMGLSVTGEADNATRAKLKQLHDE